MYTSIAIYNTKYVFYAYIHTYTHRYTYTCIPIRRPQSRPCDGVKFLKLEEPTTSWLPIPIEVLVAMKNYIKWRAIQLVAIHLRVDILNDL